MFSDSKFFLNHDTLRGGRSPKEAKSFFHDFWTRGFATSSCTVPANYVASPGHLVRITLMMITMKRWVGYRNTLKEEEDEKNVFI